MYVATIPNRGSPPAILIREGYRVGKKIKTRTLANITHWPTERVEALRRCLKGEFDGISAASDPVSDRIFGVLFVLKEMARRLGIVRALGTKPVAKLALFLVLARVAHQGSRLSAVRWADDHAVAEVLGITNFDEDDLYQALDWLAENQERIENRLYQTYVNKAGKPLVGRWARIIVSRASFPVSLLHLPTDLPLLAKQKTLLNLSNFLNKMAFLPWNLSAYILATFCIVILGGWTLRALNRASCF